MLLVVQRRPSYYNEVVVIGEPQDFGPEPYVIIRPAPDLVIGNDPFVIDNDDNWGTWTETYGPAANVRWWSVWPLPSNPF